jgi:hypothetical protein
MNKFMDEVICIASGLDDLNVLIKIRVLSEQRLDMLKNFGDLCITDPCLSDVVAEIEAVKECYEFVALQRGMTREQWQG